ncbi:OLC1v1012585C1 [Oldenlandia corymbosa var. corymbosa]|uniref:OLC1v1012585C1 n=1 Tax=Oldenlandia corymbosa var. corymbosa TaxID=529605 RepID=A0AAV1DW99_OLDCO|nr:OLC1v1012585C1 [Oldenlandia corymbosa var. corymbosa]
MAASSSLSVAYRRLAGKVALITGGASGIGEASAKLFGNHGAKVVIADIQYNLGQTLSKSLGSSNSFYIHCDVANEDHIEGAVDKAVATYGKLDIMFNNTGTIHPVLGLTKNLAVELGKYGIRVNCVSPSGVVTPLSKRFFGDEGGDVLQNALNSSANLKGVIWEAEDVAQAALYLASDDAKCVSGHNLCVDGGYTIYNSALNIL